jgi:hypothetical protein
MTIHQSLSWASSIQPHTTPLHGSFKPSFIKIRWGLWHHAVCLSTHLFIPPVTFKQSGRFSRNLVRRSCHWRWPRRYNFNYVASTVPKWRMFKLQRWTCNLHQSTWGHGVEFCNDGNHTNHVWQLNPYSFNNESRSWTKCVTIVTTLGDVLLNVVCRS